MLSIDADALRDRNRTDLNYLDGRERRFLA